MGISIYFKIWISRMSIKVHILNIGFTNLEWGKNSSKSHKYRCPCLSLKWVSKSTFKTQFWESRQKCLFSTLVSQPWTRAKITPNLIKNRCPCLSLKWEFKSTLKFQFRKSRQKCIFSTLVWQPWTRAKITPNLIKIGFHAYVSNGYLNPL